jgi:pterin-4a-carbinolamine dehydratase
MHGIGCAPSRSRRSRHPGSDTRYRQLLPALPTHSADGLAGTDLAPTIKIEAFLAPGI